MYLTYITCTITQISSVETVDQLQSMENYDLISDSGFTKPSSRLTVLDKANIIQSVYIQLF